MSHHLKYRRLRYEEDDDPGNDDGHDYLGQRRSSSARLLPTGRKNGYTLGGRQFVERFKVGLFVPMHFTTGFESAWRFKEFTEETHIPFWAISREGETIDI